MLTHMTRKTTDVASKCILLIVSLVFQYFIMGHAGNARAEELSRRAGTVQHGNPAGTMAAQRHIIDRLAEALNRGDVEAATALFDASAVVTLPGGRTVSGIDQIRDLWQNSAEQFPSRVEFGDLHATGEQLRFTSTSVAKDVRTRTHIVATIRDGKIHAYSVAAEPGAAPPSTAAPGTPLMGTVLSVHRKFSPAPTMTQAASPGLTAATGNGKQAPAAGKVPLPAGPDAPVPQFILTIKLQDGSVISVTQEEAHQPGAQVRVVSVADKRRALAAQASEPVASPFDPARNRLRPQADAGGNPLNALFAPPGVFYASWNQYQGFPTRLMPASDGICFLQGVTGNFRGGGEGVWVRNNGGFWELNGMSQQQNVAARAMCVPFSAIQGANQGFSYLIGTASAWTYYGGCSWWESCHGASAFQNLFGLDGFCYLTGMGGAFNGSGEIVSANAWAPDHWYILVNTQVVGASIIGEAGCIAAIGHSRLRTTNVAYRYAWSQGQPPVQLPNADQAFCALDWITGHFAGWGEHIDISHEPDNTQWLAGASGQQGVMAYASCMYYDQRQ